MTSSTTLPEAYEKAVPIVDFSKACGIFINLLLQW